MIGFRSSEAACGHCPLVLRCLRGKTLVVTAKTTPESIKGVQYNVFNVRYCPRCLCAHFEKEHERYLCGILRTGVRTPANKDVLGFIKRTVTQGKQAWGCGRRPGHRSLYHTRRGVTPQDFPKDDCFVEYEKVLTIVH